MPKHDTNDTLQSLVGLVHTLATRMDQSDETVAQATTELATLLEQTAPASGLVVVSTPEALVMEDDVPDPKPPLHEEADPVIDPSVPEKAHRRGSRG